MSDAQTLLADYVSGSESAFRELVTRYVDLVFSTAFRLLDGDRALAEDVTQTVFLDLARAAKTLPRNAMLGGWLHRHTCFVAAKARRGEHRRLERERQAAEMNTLESDSGNHLAELAPMLDEAIDQLSAEDRTAILLRFFERRDFRAVGQAVGTTEDGARMRVNRALAKLHERLSQKGVTLSVGALGAGLAAEAVAAAPPGLAVSAAAASLAEAGAGGVLAATLLKLGAFTKVTAGLAGAAVLLGLGTSALVQRHALRDLRAENASLKARLGEFAQTSQENRGLSNLLAQAGSAQSSAAEQGRELLRLRGEVGRLRQQNRELNRHVGPVGTNSKAEAARANFERRYGLGARADPAPPGARSPPDVPPQDIFPKAAWAFAGFAAPEATIQSLHWASLQGDVKTVASCLADPDEQAMFEEKEARRFPGESQTEIAEEIAKRLADVEGYRILERTNYPNGEVEIAFSYDGPGDVRGMRLKRVGEGWKIAPGQR